MSPSLLRSLLPLLLSCFLFLGCRAEEENERACADVTECSFGESCLEGVCTARSCSTSAQCPVGSYCSGGDCTTGCEVDDDCFPDEVCDLENKSCETRGCRDTSRDCAFGEFCDVGTGECYAASNYYCQPCIYESTNSQQCGSSENICLPFGQYGDFCGVECDATSDCPAGFDCVPVSLGGQPTTKQCLTYCWLYEDADSRALANPVPPSLLDPTAECATAATRAGGQP